MSSQCIFQKHLTYNEFYHPVYFFVTLYIPYFNKIIIGNAAVISQKVCSNNLNELQPGVESVNLHVTLHKHLARNMIQCHKLRLQLDKTVFCGSEMLLQRNHFSLELCTSLPKLHHKTDKN